MNKNPNDKINKASWTLMEGIKDAVTANLMTAFSQKTIDIKPEEFAKLLTIINASVEEGYHRASRVFDKTVESILKDVASLSSLNYQTKKKSKSD
jgi:hypothetical protein